MSYKLNKNKYLLNSRSNRWAQPTPEQIEAWVARNFDYKKSGVQLKINNPDGDTKQHLQISTEAAMVHDFRPNHQQYDGSFLKFVANYRNISFVEAVKEVCGSGRIISRYQEEVIDDGPENEDVMSLPAGSTPLKDGSGKIWSMAMNYLTKERGFSNKIIYSHKIHNLGTNIVVPYYQYGMIVFYQSRYIVDKKFNFPPGIDNKKAGNYLYGFDDVEPCGEVIVVESIFNKMSIGADCVATGGASLKDGQIKLLKSLNPHTVILAPDHDGAGIKSLSSDFHALDKERKGDLFKEILYCLPPGEDDWNDMLQQGKSPTDYIKNNKKKLSKSILFLGIK